MHSRLEWESTGAPGVVRVVRVVRGGGQQLQTFSVVVGLGWYWHAALRGAFVTIVLLLVWNCLLGCLAIFLILISIVLGMFFIGVQARRGPCARRRRG
ncbi:hypothetical protein BDV95DRAFT_560163 [Massariosphaeria phaeospora]|uniref:Uncharacterized protein n=1 Tax=Massariosphaeria phaeospora TaxID=100035 RepID=A0A7C8IEZ4_9PLEO|nr:hypothetical protein BDV95DRAFT_560163 [Massariosphaeria phaeospora]